MKYSEQLYRQVCSIWQSYETHPFLLGLFDGTLPIEKFRFYMIQDYLYLLDYAKVFALGIAKADSIEEMQFFSQNVHQILHGEMEIHRSYMQRLGISDQDAAQTSIHPANYSYTAYMLKEAYQGGVSEILAAILACSWSYADIALHLSERYPQAISHPFFGEWVAGYASQSYQATNQSLIDRLDIAAAHLSKTTLEHLSQIFQACSRYELGFWDMAWNEQA